MQRNLAATLALLFVAASAVAIDALPAETAALNLRARRMSLCSKTETVVFTCAVQKKRVSVCAKLDSVGVPNELTYRFGAPSHVERSIVSSAQSKDGQVFFASDLLAGSWSARLGFSSGRSRYYVYSASVRGSDHPTTGASTRTEPSGYAVFLDGKVLTNRLCTASAFTHNLARSFLGPAVPEDASSGIDTFELAGLSR